jgi:hypothetical protein
MAKAAIYFEEAQRLFVVEGFSIDAVESLLKKNVTRRTLYNWRDQGNWDEKRTNYLNETKDLRAEIMEVARITIKEAKQNPTPHAVYAMAKAIAALKSYDGIALLSKETTEDERKGLTKEAISEIQKSVLGIDIDD